MVFIAIHFIFTIFLLILFYSTFKFSNILHIIIIYIFSLFKKKIKRIIYIYIYILNSINKYCSYKVFPRNVTIHHWKKLLETYWHNNKIQKQFRNTQLKKIIIKFFLIKYSHKTLQCINRKREYKTRAILETLNL